MQKTKTNAVLKWRQFLKRPHDGAGITKPISDLWNINA